MNKKEVVGILKAIIDQRIQEAQRAIETLQQARNNDTKSSAGDKYETGRAMAQIEIDNHKRQLARSLQEREVYKRINFSNSFTQVLPGALVQLGDDQYLIGIGVGALDEDTYAISIASPLGMAIKKKKVGDVVRFRESELKINTIL